jgi:hypothetical protein
MKTLKELSASMNKWATTETQKMQLDLYTGIKEETPVKTGKAKAGWQTKPVSTMGDLGLINNDVEYIGWLEFGTDKMQPYGMVRRNIQRVIK